MKNLQDNIEKSGHLQIIKSYKDGSEEVVFDDHNIVVSGMGYGLSRLLSSSGSDNLIDFRIDRFQVGVSGTSDLEEVSTNRLGRSLTGESDYGANSNLFLMSLPQKVGNSQINNQIFASIPQSKIVKVGPNSIRYTITLDEDACNDRLINEVGLFMRNPDGGSPNRPILVAYRNFSTIQKTGDFSIIFKWTLNIPYSVTDLLVPTFSNEYYGPSSTPLEDRRYSQTFDLYSPANQLEGGNACAVYLHPGALTGGDKTPVPAELAEKLLKRDVTFISANYCLATENGEQGIKKPVNFPIFTSGAGYGTGTDRDSNNNLVPSSIQPFRLGNGKENAFTDGVRLIQHIKYYADKYGIDKNKIVLVGGAAGADVSLWLSMAPEVSAITADPVEAESITVYAGSHRNVITDWVTWYPNIITAENTWMAVPVGKTIFDMSGTVYVAEGTGQAQTSGPAYASGDYFSETIYNLPDHLKYGLGVLFQNRFGDGFGNIGTGFRRQSPPIPASSLHDWSNIPGLLADYQYREAPILTKEFWSGRYHASAGVEETYTLDGYDSNVDLVWGKKDNSGIYTSFEAIGVSTSATAFEGPSWRLLIPLTMLNFWTSGVDQFFGNAAIFKPTDSGLAASSIDLTTNLLDPDAVGGIPSGTTVREYYQSIVDSFPVPGAIEILNPITSEYVNATGIIDILAPGYLDLSGFGWGPPTNGIDRYEVSSLIGRFTGTPEFIPEPTMNIETSTIPGVDSSAVGNGPAFNNKTVTPDPHDPIMPIEMLQDMRTNLGGVHDTSSFIHWTSPDKYINLTNFFDILEPEWKTFQVNVRVEWIIKVLSESEPYYSQYIETLPITETDEIYLETL